MDNLAIFDLKDREGKPCVTSKQVAEAFGKKHKHVMRDIRVITDKCSESFTGLNFQLSEYTDSTGRKLPMYLLTKDGFTMLAMGYTTPEAMKIKVAYITRFNEMEEQLRARQQKLEPRSYLKALQALIAEVEQRQLAEIQQGEASLPKVSAGSSQSTESSDGFKSEFTWI